MSGLFFKYEPGRLDVSFRQEKRCDDIYMDVTFHGDTATTTPCNDQWELGEPTTYGQGSVSFFVYMDNTFCPFRDFIRFLEAITIEVQECQFEWDAAGPTGIMHWRRRSTQETSFLTIEWLSSPQKSFKHRIMLNTREMVTELYTKFRKFVESDDYDPLGYENMTLGETIPFVLTDTSTDELLDMVSDMNHEVAIELLDNIFEVAWDRHLHCGGASHNIDQYKNMVFDEKYGACAGSWISTEWDSCNKTERLDILNHMIKSNSNIGGNQISTMKSTLIETWLKTPNQAISTLDLDTK